MPNAVNVHPLLSKEIVQHAGLHNPLILESIMQHEEKLDGTGYPKRIKKMHEYAQISQIVNQY
jgi:HD-GYP domain-containing protein (c-di-GMP phosphodiesterase class II)